MFKAMLVEDNVIFRESLRDSLQQKFPSIEIVEAGSGAEALGKIGSLPPI
jgi:CheY-like chemotaxis protein